MTTQIARATIMPTIVALPARTSRRRRVGLMGMLVGVIAGLAMMCTAGSASASTAALTPGTFNASLSSAWNWGDCYVEVGPVVDYYSPWAAIAGALAECGGRHASTTITVGLKFNGAIIGGSVRSYHYSNSYGTGTHIVTTPRYCGSGVWQETATMTISGLGSLTFTGFPAMQTTGCS